MARRIDRERIKLDLVNTRANIIRRYNEGSFNDLQRTLVEDIGKKYAFWILPSDIESNENGGFALNINLSKCQKKINASYSPLFDFYRELPEYDSPESDLPEKAGQMLTDIGDRLVEANKEGLAKGRKYYNKRFNRLILSFSFNHEDYLLGTERRKK